MVNRKQKRKAAKVIPCLEADKCILDASLVVFDHVLVHVWIVLPDVPLGAAIWDRAKTKWR